MKKKIIIGIIIIVLISLAPFSSIVGANESQIENLIKIRTTISQINGSDDNEIQVTEEEAYEIIAILKELNQALVENDIESISNYEKILKEKGILGKHQNLQVQNNIFRRIRDILVNYKAPFSDPHSQIYNNNCLTYFSGIINYRKDIIEDIFLLSGIIYIILCMICQVSLPGLLIFGIPVIIYDILFPLLQAIVYIQSRRFFRVFAPASYLKVVNGTISTWGQNGTIKKDIDLNIYLYGFCGTQIQIWLEGSERYLFLFGFSSFISAH